MEWVFLLNNDILQSWVYTKCFVLNFAEVMKGYDYKNLKSLIGDDQADLGKLKKWKQVKDSS